MMLGRRPSLDMNDMDFIRKFLFRENNRTWCSYASLLQYLAVLIWEHFVVQET